jgi:carboxypeptidase family protein/PDZ domain-containing protein
LGPVQLGWLSRRWPFVVAVVAWLVLLVGPSMRRAPAPPTSSVAAGALRVTVAVSAAQGGCEAPDAGPCARAAAPMPPLAGGVEPPLSGARVRAFDASDPTLPLSAQSISGTAGVAELELAAGTYWLLVDAPGRVRRSESLVLTSPAATLAVALPPAVPLSVRVQDVDGHPIAGATVLVRAGDPLPYGALTAADGVARLEHVGARPESVRVTAPGYDAASASPTSRDVRVTLGTPATLDLAVRLASGEPAPEALVWVSGVDVWPPRELHAGADGQARLEGLSRGTYDLRARLGEAVSASSSQVTIEPGRRQQVTLVLTPGRFVSVRVSHANEPVSGARVTLAEDGLSPFPLSEATSADGVVRLGPLPAVGKLVASVRASGYMSESVPVPARGDAEVAVELVRGGSVTGRVLDAEGNPIEGARLEVVGDDVRGRPIARRSGGVAVDAALALSPAIVPMGELGVMSGPLPVPGMPPPGPAPVSTWVTDLDGNYRLDDVPPGRIRVLARHPDFVDVLSEPVDLAPGATAGIELRLGRGASLGGRVVDELGRPVPRARVDIVSREVSSASALTAADGSFTFRAVPPSFDLLVARPDARQRFVLRKELTLSTGEAREIQLTLPAERAALAVLVLGASDRPLAGATVSLLSLDPEVPLRLAGESDVRGECLLPDAAGLAATLRVHASGYVPFSTELDPVPERVGVTLTPGLSVSGRVTRVRGREPVAGAEVTLQQGDQRAAAKTDERGQYTLEGVALGAAVLSVRHRDFSAETWDVTIEPGLREGMARELEPIDLVEPAFASGTVVDANGDPVRGARVGVGLVPAFVPAGAALAGVVETDARGRFELRGLAPGRVTVSAYATGHGRGSLPDVELRAGEGADGLVIRLEPRGAGDEPPPAASVAVTLGERRNGDELEVVIVNVAAGSEAERANVRSGDVLWSVDDELVLDMAEARRALGGSVGSDVILELERDGHTRLVRLRREAVE